MNNITELLRGVLEGSILQIIGEHETYGYDITQRLQTLGFEDVVEGTVYTILVRLEKAGHIEAERLPSSTGPPRKFYSLTKSGQDELLLFWTKYDFVSSKINNLRSM